MSPRLKKAPPATPATREEMETLVGEIASLTITQDGLMVEMDRQIQAVRHEYETTLAQIRLSLDGKLEAARLWAVTNPEAFGQKKSLEMVHGTIGFRTGMPKLKAKRGITWEIVLDLLRKCRLTDYIRSKEEVDKDRLIADRETLGDKLAQVGVEVVQDEAFYLDPKRETTEEV
jgi:phage host-nuclease inhibitor protein Gam